MRKGNTPRRKRFNKKQRIESGKNWIPKYEGKNLIKGYSKWYGVNLITAILELREIGVEISQEYERNVRNSINDRIQKTKELKRLRNKSSSPKQNLGWADCEFEIVAGYTSNGFPYGIENSTDSDGSYVLESALKSQIEENTSELPINYQTDSELIDYKH